MRWLLTTSEREFLEGIGCEDCRSILDILDEVEKKENVLTWKIIHYPGHTEFKAGPKLGIGRDLISAIISYFQKPNVTGCDVIDMTEVSGDINILLDKIWKETAPLADALPSTLTLHEKYRFILERLLRQRKSLSDKDKTIRNQGILIKLLVGTCAIMTVFISVLLCLNWR